MNASTDIIEKAQQGESAKLMQRYRQLLTEGTPDEAAELRRIAHELGRADRMHDDRLVLRRLAGEAELGREYKQASERLKKASAVKDETIAERDRLANEAHQKLTKLQGEINAELFALERLGESQRELKSLRARNRDLLA